MLSDGLVGQGDEHGHLRYRDARLEGVHVTVARHDEAERQGTYRLVVSLALDGPLTDEQRAALARAAANCPITS